jgi:hypothetical protein
MEWSTKNFQNSIMKKTLFVMFLALLLSSCGVISQEPSTSVSIRDRQKSTSIPQVATPYPEPTVDYSATQSSLALTQQALREQMIEVTAESERRIHEQLSWTQQADMMTATPAALTQQSGIATSTAALTAIPLTKTAYAPQATSTEQAAIDKRTALAATQQAPTLMIAEKNAQLYVEYAETGERIKIGIMAAIGVFILSLAFFLYVHTRNVVSMSTKTESPEEEAAQPKEPIKPLRHVKFDGGGDKWLDAQIPCTKEQLFELAEGVVKRRMTLGYNIWEGTIVHKSLKAIRHFFQEHRFAKVVHNGEGSLDILSDGEAFLRYVAEHGEPPAPFQCLPENG